VAPRRRLAAAAVPAPAPRAPRRLPRIGARLRWIATGALFFAAIAALGAGAMTRRLAVHPAFAIRAVTVSGEEHVSDAALLELAGIEVGSSWLTLDRPAIERRMESHPWVRRARLHRPWPGRVRLAIDEFEPVARVEIAHRVYGICAGLQIVPSAADSLPLLRARGRVVADPDALWRGLAYVAALRKVGLLPGQRVELELSDSSGDRLVLPERGFSALVDGTISAPLAVKDVAVFLERLDAEGGSRGTLRLVSGGTGVWRATSGRPSRAG
jgi:hypothetical protein